MFSIYIYITLFFVYISQITKLFCFCFFDFYFQHLGVLKNYKNLKNIKKRFSYLNIIIIIFNKLTQ